MDPSLAQSLRGLALTLIAMAAILCGGAGTFAYGRAWLFLAAFTLWCVVLTLYVWKTDPALLARRQSAGPAAEKTPSQRRIMLAASAGFLALVLVPALDRRFGWSAVPDGVAAAGHALLALGFYGFFLTFRDNTFAAATIVVEPDQRVVDTGLYAAVRHPMYAAALPMFLGMPLALGSWWGVLVMPPLTAVIVWRLIDEEHYLTKHLAGYAAYCRKVPWRLVPRLW